MKKLELDKKLERKTEELFLISTMAERVAREYPRCWAMILGQYKSTCGNSWNDHYQDDVENFKVRLYAEIARQDKENRDRHQKNLEDKRKEAIKKAQRVKRK